MCHDVFKYIIKEVCSIINVSILLYIITIIGRAKSCDPEDLRRVSQHIGRLFHVHSRITERTVNMLTVFHDFCQQHSKLATLK